MAARAGIVNLSFSGAGFLGIYQVGVIAIAGQPLGSRRAIGSACRDLTTSFLPTNQLGAAAGLREILGANMAAERVATFIGTSVRVCMLLKRGLRPLTVVATA
jgi:hypothetical protein